MSYNSWSTISFEDRFWRKVDVRGKDECWPWIGATRGKGYGVMTGPDGKRIAAHRAALLIAKGALISGLHVLHRCDNPPCCNPRHLFEGTNADNTKDAFAKGRRTSPFIRPEIRHRARQTKIRNGYWRVK